MPSITRREFTAAAALAVTAKSYAQIRGANERLRIGAIGCGGQAKDHFANLVKMRESDNIDIISVCDVWDIRAAEGAKITGGKIVKDYRRVLDDKDVDYVLIATPEHWHCRMTLDAVAAHKHIYCEKPMTRTVEES